MLLPLALLAQTATLPAGTVEAARTCAAIEFRSVGDPPSLADLVRYFHLVFVAARTTRGTGRMLDHVPAELAIIQPRALAGSDDMALRSECRQRFPQTWATQAVLPKDDFDRGVMCVAAVATIGGLANSVGDSAAERRWRVLNDRLITLPVLTNQQQHRRGIMSSEAARTNSDRMLQVSLDLGNTLTVATACEVAYPG